MRSKTARQIQTSIPGRMGKKIMFNITRPVPRPSPLLQTRMTRPRPQALTSEWSKPAAPGDLQNLKS
jgi:hypothetical protein